MNIPILFSTLKPKLTDPAWFNVDQPCDDENEVAQLEQEYNNYITSVSHWNSELSPMGKTASEALEDDEEEDDEDDNDDDDDESESHDDEDEVELDMDVSQERNSPVDLSIRLVQGHGVMR